MARLALNCILMSIMLYLVHRIQAFECDLAPRPKINMPSDPAQPLIEDKELIRPALEILFGGIPGASIGLFVVDKFLSNLYQSPSVWDQVKEKVENVVHAKIDNTKLNDLCNTLRELRKRLDLCGYDEEQAKTDCLKNLVDHMISQEPHFQGKEGRDVALMLGAYTQYTVMTLAVGNMFIKQHKKYPVKGTGTLVRLKPAAKGFSAYVNASIELAVEWRKMEVGHYKKQMRGFFGWSNDGEGVIGVNRKRSVQAEFKDNATLTADVISTQVQKALSRKSKIGIRRKAMPTTWRVGKLIVKDRVSGKTIFDDTASAMRLERAYENLFEKANPIVERHRKEEEKTMRKIYEEQVLPITNQYWRIYDGDDFGDPEKEAKNRLWLNQVEASNRRSKPEHGRVTHD